MAQRSAHVRSTITAITATAALLAASCAADESGPAAPQGDGEPTKGGTLVVAISSDPDHLNPAITTSGATHTASELLYNGLVRLDEQGTPQPELAESWEVTEDGARYTFALRDDVTWHDGESFTSADVKFAFEEVLLKYHSRTQASLGEALTAIETPDEQTVEFVFDEPYGPLLQQLDVTEAPIVAEHVYEGTDPLENPANTEPIGTGPFTLESYQPDAEIRFTANEDYFKADLPYLDGVVMRVIPEESNQVVALESGEVQWLWGVPGPDLERLRADGRFEFLETSVNPGGANCIMTVAFNLDRPMFDDVDTRRGIALAIDKQQFLDRVQFGQGKVAEAPISSGISFAHADDLDDMPSYDPDEAARLLDEAGWVREGDGTRTAQGVDGVKDGTPLSFDFLHFSTFADYGELFRAQLAKIGAEVELRSMEPPVFVEKVFTEREFDTNVISYCNGNDPEIGVKRMYLSSNIGPVPFSNAAGYRNTEVDTLFEEARTTIGDEERKEAYRRLQEALVADLPYTWLVETTANRVYHSRCRGFSHSGHFAEAAYCDEG
ncbi:ABC transporter substrate-binding protein [Haloechinothrix halophila]|uniref:ABC transporter substrate-binding protein n=1 Tax=Haloechinothrix halophila TaxID=1069073 RepID=UPI000410C5D5|nr:ABC transporter substrate-binding protein [Haloechinothrix halophila]